MYGEEASKLAREAKRTIDHFPPYNNSLVQSVIREIQHLYDTCQELIRNYNTEKLQVEAEVERRWHEQHEAMPIASQNSASGSASSGTATATAIAATTSQPPSSEADSHTTLAMLEDLPPASSSTVHSISTIGLQEQKQQALRPLEEVFWTKYLVHTAPLQRNKRVLMAYHHQRIEKIKELA
ncbi:hypothetical protein BGZ65_012917, partial [Modicella reniformis]